MLKIGFVRSSIILAASIVLGGLFCGSGVKASVYISGQVVQDPSHAAVPAATVTLSAQDRPLPVDVCQSLHNGSFVLTAPGPGHYQLTAAGDDFYPVSQSIDVPRRGLASLSLRVHPRAVLQLQVVGLDIRPVTTGRIRVMMRVTWPARDARSAGPAAVPPQEARMGIAKEPSRQGVLQVTAAENFPEPEQVKSFALAVYAPGVGYSQMRLDKWPARLLVVRLRPMGSLTGVLLDNAGRPLASVTVIATRTLISPDEIAARPRGWATTDAAGHFTMDSLPPGHYELQPQNLDPKLYPPTGVDVTERGADVTLKPAGK